MADRFRAKEHHVEITAVGLVGSKVKLEEKLLLEGSEVVDLKTGQRQQLTSTVVIDVAVGNTTPTYSWNVDDD